jgi:hypothetical protein
MTVPDIDDLEDPEQAHDAWEDITDLDAAALRALEDDPYHEAYLDVAEGREVDDEPLDGGPLEDALTLATTPRDEWEQEHLEEAAEAQNWLARHGAQFEPDEGEDLIEGDDVYVNKREVAGARWGFDLDDDGWP